MASMSSCYALLEEGLPSLINVRAAGLFNNLGGTGPSLTILDVMLNLEGSNRCAAMAWAEVEGDGVVDDGWYGGLGAREVGNGYLESKDRYEIICHEGKCKTTHS